MAPALAVPALQSHRAVYDLTLDNASDRSGIPAHRTPMVYEFNVLLRAIRKIPLRHPDRPTTTPVDRPADDTFEDAEGKTFPS